MPRFEIVYSAEPTSKALASETIVARDRLEAANRALTGLRNAQLQHGAAHFRILDGLGMVVTRGPKSATKHVIG